jgi:hypothetical protein
MKRPLDIFRKEPKGPVWIAAVENAASAKAAINELCREFPGEYVIFNQETGTQLQFPCPPGEIRA